MGVAFLFSESIYFAGGYLTIAGYFTDIAIIFGAGAAFFLIADIPNIYINILLPESNIIPHYRKLIEWALRLFRFTKGRISKSDDLGVNIPRWFKYVFYPNILWHTEGIAVLLSALAGAGFMVYRHSFFDIYIVALFALFTILFAISPYKSARMTVASLPLPIVCAAAIISAMPVWMAAPVLAWITIRGVIFGLRISKLTSGMKAAAEYVNSMGESRFISTCSPYAKIYGPDNFNPGLPVAYDAITYFFFMQKIRYLVVDHHEYFPGMANDNTVEVIQKYIDPVFTAEDPCATFYPLRAESEYYSSKHVYEGDEIEVSRWNRFVKSPAEKDTRVRVYDLKDVFYNNNRYGFVGRMFFWKPCVI